VEKVESQKNDKQADHKMSESSMVRVSLHGGGGDDRFFCPYWLGDGRHRIL
jgi:hypothetical protein